MSGWPLKVPVLLQSQPLIQVRPYHLALRHARPLEPPLGVFTCLPPFSPLLLTALNWLHFNTKSRHFFFKVLFPRVSLEEEQGVEVALVDTVVAFRNKCGSL